MWTFYMKLCGKFFHLIYFLIGQPVFDLSWIQKTGSVTVKNQTYLAFLFCKIKWIKWFNFKMDYIKIDPKNSKN